MLVYFSINLVKVRWKGQKRESSKLVWAAYFLNDFYNFVVLLLRSLLYQSWFNILLLTREVSICSSPGDEHEMKQSWQMTEWKRHLWYRDE